MKIVGKAKGKNPKAWCLMRDICTGHYFVGGDDKWPVSGPYDRVLAAAQEARDTLGPEPDVGVDIPWPGFHVNARPSHAAPLTQAQKDQYAAYEESNKRKYAHSQWQKQRDIGRIEPPDYMPIFEDELEFMHYSRGRSSVTLVFKASNDQLIEFGPSGIDDLIRGIINGVCKIGDIGIKARFKFVKKGANTYAELVED